MVLPKSLTPKDTPTIIDDGTGQSEKETLHVAHLPSGFQYHTVDEYGGVILQDVYARFRYGVRQTLLSPSLRAALVLNETCRHRGRDMVYTLPPHPQELRGRVTAADFAVSCCLNALPELFYVKCRWSSLQQAEYQAMTPTQKVHRLSARHGWIDDAVPGVVIGIDVDAFQRVRMRFNGVTEAPVTIILTPRPYVGMTEELVQHCRRVYKKDGNGQDKMCSYDGKEEGWSNFQKFLVPGVEGILDKLENILHTEDEGLMCYGTVRKWIETEHQKAELMQRQSSEPHSTTKPSPTDPTDC